MHDRGLLAAVSPAKGDGVATDTRQRLDSMQYGIHVSSMPKARVSRR
jgi:hypothetical protein